MSIDTSESTPLNRGEPFVKWRNARVFADSEIPQQNTDPQREGGHQVGGSRKTVKIAQLTRDMNEPMGGFETERYLGVDRQGMKSEAVFRANCEISADLLTRCGGPLPTPHIVVI